MEWDRANGRIVLSVQELCALALGGGAVRTPGRGEPEAPAGGAGVRLSHVFPLEDVTFEVYGTADRVGGTPDAPVVETVLPSAGSPEALVRRPGRRARAELACLGCLLCASGGLPSVTLRLTGARAEDGAVACAEEEAEAGALEDGLRRLLAAVLPIARDRIEREQVVRKAAATALFPYPSIRTEQERMIRELWRDMRAGRTVFAQAPTGIGKTMAALYPAVRCYGEGRCDRIFYLTAKNAARREAFAAVRKLNEAGTPIRASLIAARESLCLRASGSAPPARPRTEPDRPALWETEDAWRGRAPSRCGASCPYAAGYRDRGADCVREMLAGGRRLFGAAEILEEARSRGVCPYELSLDLSEACEIVVCDYNYLFSPTASLDRYFADGAAGRAGGRYLFLIDEAHNLADRAREMYTGELRLSWVREAGNALLSLGADRDGDGELLGAIGETAALFAEAAVPCGATEATGGDGVRRGVSLDRAEPEAFCEAARRLREQCERWLYRRRRLRDEEGAAGACFRAVDALAGALWGFVLAADRYGRNFAAFTETAGDDVRLRLLCLDPSAILRPLLRKAAARALFSATLTPADYFADILGGGRRSVSVSFDSPFPPENLCVAVGTGVSARFGDRERSVGSVVSHIAAAVSARKGNYIVYFPSYDYLEKARALFVRRYPGIRAVAQSRRMTAAEREAFIGSFAPTGDRTQVGFCVLGGSFAEGVDLPGRRLIGAVIVGVGIPGLSNERNIMKEYYDETRDGEGYAYAYLYPGMNRVLQAAGRVIRRAEDRGVVVLLDDRYASEPYLRLYPAHWARPAAARDPRELSAILRAFWAEADRRPE